MCHASLQQSSEHCDMIFATAISTTRPPRKNAKLVLKPHIWVLTLRSKRSSCTGTVFELPIKTWGLSFELWNLSAKISGLGIGITSFGIQLWGLEASTLLQQNFGRTVWRHFRSWDGITTLQAIRLPCATQLLYMPR